MALRDTTWITTAHAITTLHTKGTPKTVTILNNPLTQSTYKQVVENRVREWVCLTQAAATGYAVAHGADTSTKVYSATVQNPILNSWKLTETFRSDAYELVPPDTV